MLVNTRVNDGALKQKLADLCRHLAISAVLEIKMNPACLYFKCRGTRLVNLIKMKNARLPPSSLQVQMWDREITM